MSVHKHIVNAFKQFCGEIGFHFQQLSPSQFMTLNSGHDGKWPIFCYLDNTSITFYAILPVVVPPAKRLPVMEYLTRTNYGLVVGNFEFDLDDGEVRYKTSMDIMDGKLTTAMVGALLGVNCSMVDRYLKGLLQILLMDSPPSAVIQVVEGTDEASLDADDLSELLEDIDLDQLPKQGDD